MIDLVRQSVKKNEDRTWFFQNIMEESGRIVERRAGLDGHIPIQDTPIRVYRSVSDLGRIQGKNVRIAKWKEETSEKEGKIHFAWNPAKQMFFPNPCRNVVILLDEMGK